MPKNMLKIGVESAYPHGGQFVHACWWQVVLAYEWTTLPTNRVYSCHSIEVNVCSPHKMHWPEKRSDNVDVYTVGADSLSELPKQKTV